MYCKIVVSEVLQLIALLKVHSAVYLFILVKTYIHTALKDKSAVVIYTNVLSEYSNSSVVKTNLLIKGKIII